jgi:hypothetical protein
LANYNDGTFASPALIVATMTFAHPAPAPKHTERSP